MLFPPYLHLFDFSKHDDPVRSTHRSTLRSTHDFSKHADPVRSTHIPEYKHDSSINVLYLNSRSLVNKINLLRSYVAAYSPGIICVTETWGTCDLPDQFFHIDSYVLHRCDRTSCKGGGVMIYVSSSYVSFTLRKLYADRVEAITCQVNGTNCDIVLTCVYVPPNYTWPNNLLVDYLHSVCNYTNMHCVICGDFNSPDINWTCPDLRFSNSPLLRWCMDNFLTQNILNATRPQSGTILDLVFSSIDTTISGININECFGTSDHSTISFTINLPVSLSSSTSPEIYCFSRANWRKFRRHLRNSYWIHNENCTIDQMWRHFRDNITEAAASSIPRVSKTRSNPLNNPKVKSAILLHRRNFKLFTKNPTLGNRLKCLLSQKAVDTSINSAIRNQEFKIAQHSKSNPKAFWSLVNQNLKSKVPFQSMRDGD